MRTLEEVFKENLKRLRGRRTQAEVAEAAGIPLRSYQHAESGIIPQGPNRTAIAAALGVGRETELFLDQELAGGGSAKARLLELVATFDEDQARAMLSEAEAIKAGLGDALSSKPEPVEADESERDSG